MLCERTSKTQGLVCDFQGDQSIAISDATLATHLYRIAQEAVRNAVKHARADRITVQLTQKEGKLTLQVADNGIGIPADADESPGIGHRSMSYRAGLIGAALEMQAGQNGGTTVTCTLSRVAEADELDTSR